MSIESSHSTQSEALVLPEIEGYLARKTFPEIELPKIFNTHDPLVIFDIGACEGEDSIRYARLFPNSRVYTFEPLPENQSLVLANFEKFGVKNAELHRIALADREGTSTFHVSSGKPPEKWEGEQWNYGNKASSLLKPALDKSQYGWIEFKKTIPIECKRLDAFCCSNKIKTVHFIHLDVQGAELMVLNGGGELLPEIQTIWMEVGENEEYAGQAKRIDVEKFMRENGFRLIYFNSTGQWGDQFWVNTRSIINKKYLIKRKISILASKFQFKKVLKKLLYFISKKIKCSINNYSCISNPELRNSKNEVKNTSTYPKDGIFPRAHPLDNFARFREIVSDPLNLLIERVPEAGYVKDEMVVLHNGIRVPVSGAAAYYGGFSSVFIVNRGVHEPLEEYVFQNIINIIPGQATMIELGAYWGHYSMWLKKVKPSCTVFLVEPDLNNLNVGKENFRRNGLEGVFINSFVGTGQFEIDEFINKKNINKIEILHCDIQGYEIEMLKSAHSSLANGLVDHLLISTHSQDLHNQALEIIKKYDYRIEVSCGYDEETTSFDGFIYASKKILKSLFSEFKPMGRMDILFSDKTSRVHYLDNLLRLQAN
jgi:FkbM family methyltransferase